jgi:Fuc2NAc and GlcNAc transferase
MNFLLIFILSTCLVYFYRNLALRYGILDKPNHRTSHDAITPRGGGVVFIGLWLVWVVLSLIQKKISSELCYSLIGPVGLVALVSFFDDYFNLRRRYRLISHLFASMLCLLLLGHMGFDIGSVHISYSIYLYFLIAFIMTWSINLYNFMDGLDGLASTQSVFIFFVSGCLLFYIGNKELGYLSCLLAFSVLGFLVWNWPSAKIFMGDVGSTSLGLSVAVFMLLAEKSHSLSFIIYLMLYLPFITDATLTLLRRIIAGDKWYEAHNNHGFQRLYRSGWSHKQVLLGLITLNLVSIPIVLGAFFYPKYIYSFLVLDIALVGYSYYQIECTFPMEADCK